MNLSQGNPYERKENTMKKGLIRKELGIKGGGRIQISSHGAGLYSVQVIRNGKVREDIDISDRVVHLARD